MCVKGIDIKAVSSDSDDHMLFCAMENKDLCTNKFQDVTLTLNWLHTCLSRANYFVHHHLQYTIQRIYGFAYMDLPMPRKRSVSATQEI